MKRTAIALTLILALLISVLAGAQFINLGKANPFPTYPVISIESPTNKTYTVNSLFLNATIVTQWDGLYFTSERRVVSYCIDGKESIPITQTEYRFDSEKQVSILSGSAVLADLTEGTHNLRVNAEYHYDNGKQVFVSDSNVNFTIDPTYSPSLSPSPSPSPTQQPTINTGQHVDFGMNPLLYFLGIVAVVIIAIIILVGLAVYFTKHRKKKTAN